jgi:ribosomal protein S18 acetylase RimI-like enzyme
VDDLVLRPYRPRDDDDAIRAIRAAAPRADADVEPPGPGDPVALRGGEVVGFGHMTWWDEADGIRLYLLSGCVHPGARRQGVGRRLLARQEERAAAHWAAQRSDGTPLLGGNADENRPGNLALLESAGYRVRFTVVELARDPAGASDVDLPAPLEVQPVVDDHHPLIFAALRTCFDRPGLGQLPMTYAQYRDEISDVDLWQVAWDGDTIAGAVLNERRPDGSVDTPWVAVLPAWRRRGVARALLQRNLRLLAAQGVRKAVIRTVQENPDRTVALYEAAGYRVTARHPRYAKPLIP